MSGFLDWLPGVLEAAGVDVYVMPGAETRTTRSSGLSPQGVVWHHTATSTAWQDGHVAALLRDGRRDLPGPLSQVGIERDGTWVIVALGRANHNGFGHWGNDSIGLEFYNSGTGEPWSDAQVESGIRGTRAILGHLDKRAATAVLGHKESDPDRKIDPLLDMGDIRRRITAEPVEPNLTPTLEDIDIMLLIREEGTRELYLVTGSKMVWVRDGKSRDTMRKAQPRLGDVADVSAETMDSFKRQYGLA